MVDGTQFFGPGLDGWVSVCKGRVLDFSSASVLQVCIYKGWSYLSAKGLLERTRVSYRSSQSPPVTFTRGFHYQRASARSRVSLAMFMQTAVPLFANDSSSKKKKF